MTSKPVKFFLRISLRTDVNLVYGSPKKTTLRKLRQSDMHARHVSVFFSPADPKSFRCISALFSRLAIIHRRKITIALILVTKLRRLEIPLQTKSRGVERSGAFYEPNRASRTPGDSLSLSGVSISILDTDSHPLLPRFSCRRFNGARFLLLPGLILVGPLAPKGSWKPGTSLAEPFPRLSVRFVPRNDEFRIWD